MASLADVAKAAGVSVTTASFVLNGLSEEKRIAPATAERVLNTVRELGYVPNVAAKKLTNAEDRKNVIPDIAVLWTPDLHDSFLSTFVPIAQSSFDAGIVPKMRITIAPFTRGPIRSTDRLFIDRHYNGAVFSPRYDSELEYFKSLSLRIPVVVLHIPTENYDNVVVDNYACGKLAAEVFARNGHRSAEMYYFPHLGSTAVPDFRLNGFREGCAKNALTCRCHEIPDSARTSVAARSGFGRHIAEQQLSSGTVPEAIFIQDDVITSGYVTALCAAGVRIPEHTEIITYGCDNLAAAICPSVTTMDYPITEITLETLRLLAAKLSNPFATPQQIITVPTVSFRESCPMPKGWGTPDM